MKPTKNTTALSRNWIANNGLPKLKRVSCGETKLLICPQLCLISSKNENKDPHCSSPGYFYTKDGVKRRETASSNHSFQNFLPTFQYQTILQLPIPTAMNTNSPQTSLKIMKTKSFDQRQLKYYQIWANISGTKSSPYNIRHPWANARLSSSSFSSVWLRNVRNAIDGQLSQFMTTTWKGLILSFIQYHSLKHHPKSICITIKSPLLIS